MLIPITEISTAGLLRLMRDVAAELELRHKTPELRQVQEPTPVHVMRVPPEADADFVLMIVARLQAGGYVKAAERERVAQISEEFGAWVKRQGLPTTHNAGDWKRAKEAASAARARMR